MKAMQTSVMTAVFLLAAAIAASAAEPAAPAKASAGTSVSDKAATKQKAPAKKAADANKAKTSADKKTKPAETKPAESKPAAPPLSSEACGVGRRVTLTDDRKGGVVAAGSGSCVIELDDGTVTNAAPDALRFDGAKDKPAQRP